MKKKRREILSVELAARALFLSDRICCVCRAPGKPIQIHHIDENPSNSSFENLAVLCFDCHRDTQIHGGFDRKLDAEQIILYRDDWLRVVAQRRVASNDYTEGTEGEAGYWIELVTSLAEIYRESQEYELLAIHYHKIGNYDLRDKYVEVAIDNGAGDMAIWVLRSMQGKPELIPKGVIKRELARLTQAKNWLGRARLYRNLGSYREAVADYLRGASEQLETGNMHSAAFFLDDMIRGNDMLQGNLVEELYVSALKEAQKKKDLWWQVRALQALGWETELNELLLRNAKGILRSRNIELQSLLARAQEDAEKYVEIKKAMAQTNTLHRIQGEKLQRVAH